MPKAVKKKKSVWRGTVAILGFDVSMSSIAGAAVGYDSVMKSWKGPVCNISRWLSDDDYFSRLNDAAHADRHVHALIAQLGVFPELHEIHIGVEEPWPFGIVKRAESGWLKQQAQVSGAFLGGLVRYGYRNVFEINSMSWRSLVADDLGITTHFKSWNADDQGKFRAKQWAEEVKGWNFNFPDLIQKSKVGKIDKPEGSRAKPVQAADQYDALAICEYMRTEVRRGL
jgi:hypothetical protein